MKVVRPLVLLWVFGMMLAGRASPADFTYDLTADRTGILIKGYIGKGGAGYTKSIG